MADLSYIVISVSRLLDGIADHPSAVTGTGNSSPTKPKATPVKKTPTRGKKTPTSKKQQDSSDVSDNEVNEATPATSRSKRIGTKRNDAHLNGEDSDSNGDGAGDDSNDDAYGEDGEGGMKKKVKIEVWRISIL